jgi:hypothetical protein
MALPMCIRHPEARGCSGFVRLAYIPVRSMSGPRNEAHVLQAEKASTVMVKSAAYHHRGLINSPSREGQRGVDRRATASERAKTPAAGVSSRRSPKLPQRKM